MLNFASKFVYAAKKESDEKANNAKDDADADIIEDAELDRGLFSTLAAAAPELLDESKKSRMQSASDNRREAYAGKMQMNMDMKSRPRPSGPAGFARSSMPVAAGGIHHAGINVPSDVVVQNEPQKPSISAQARSRRQADVNVVSVKFGPLGQSADEIHAGDPIFCGSCQSVFNQNSRLLVQNDPSLVVRVPDHNADVASMAAPQVAKVPLQSMPNENVAASVADMEPINPDAKVWPCDFCQHRNYIVVDEEERPKRDSVDYVLEVAPEQKDNVQKDDGYLIFCIDTSGSMCVTTEVQGVLELRGAKKFGVDMESMGAEFYQPNMHAAPKRTTWVSRLQAVQMAVDKQLLQLAQLYPHRKVCLISFNREVTILGDGNSPVEVIAGDKLMNQAQLEAIGAAYELNAEINVSKDKLLDKLYTLEEDGPTALGPALLVATSLASKRAGSSIIICTDGLANVGLGSLDRNADRQSAVNWYTAVGEQAKQAGVTVSVISLKGDECALEDMGRVAELTGGTVDRVDAFELTKNFNSILANRILATRVTATLLLCKAMQFRDELLVAPDAFQVTRDVGNATEDTEFTFQFSVREPELLALYAINNHLPFQLKIAFTKLDGMKCLRVISKSQAITAERDVAEKELDLVVLSAVAAQKSVLLAKQGHVKEARATALAWGKMVQQSAVSSSVEPIANRRQQAVGQYSNFLNNMDKLDAVLQEQQIDHEIEQHEEELAEQPQQQQGFLGAAANFLGFGGVAPPPAPPAGMMARSALNMAPAGTEHQEANKSAPKPQKKMKDSHYSVMQNMSSSSAWKKNEEDE